MIMTINMKRMMAMTKINMIMMMLTMMATISIQHLHVGLQQVIELSLRLPVVGFLPPNIYWQRPDDAAAAGKFPFRESLG